MAEENRKQSLAQKKKFEEAKQKMAEEKKRKAEEDRLRKQEEMKNEQVPDPETSYKLFLSQKKRNVKELWRRLFLGIENKEQLAKKMEEISKDMTEKGLFIEAKEFAKFATTDVEHARVLHEASRVAMCMQSYRDALEFL